MKQEEQIMQWIDGHREDIIDFLQQLIRVPSVNPWFLMSRLHPRRKTSRS